MPWTYTPLSERLATLPLVLVGPILRKTQKNFVSVFFALKKSKTVTLKIYSRNDETVIFQGVKKTTSLGEHVHVVVVTASTTNSDDFLDDTKVYQYDVTFTGEDGDGVQTLASSGVLKYGESGISKIIYGTDSLPTFSLPPDYIPHLRILHSSCRKFHGENVDALSGVSEIIRDSFNDDSIEYAKNRPHQLHLTGDQIYADDVADIVLFLIKDLRDTLFGWEESYSPELPPSHESLKTGSRGGLVRSAKLSSKDTSLEYRKSHLIYLTEYFSMYLLAWSIELWPNFTSEDLEDETLVDYFFELSETTTSNKELFNTELTHLRGFISELPEVRRAMANIPVYMILDDHEITDDLFLNRYWARTALNNTLGSRIIQNGLTAYAIFQAWGNHAGKFKKTEDITTSGWKLLDLLNKNADSSNFTDSIDVDGTSMTYWERFGQLVGMPSYDELMSTNNLVPHEDGIDWSFTLNWDKFQIVALNIRTKRSYPDGEDHSYAMLIGAHGLGQLDHLDSTKEFVIIISPVPVAGVPRVENLKKDFYGEMLRDVGYLLAKRDAEDWGLQREGVERLLAKIASELPNGKVVLLCGDVHYGFNARIQHWATSRFGNDSTGESKLVIAQFTAGSLKNEKKGTTESENMHTMGWVIGLDSRERPGKWIGYNNPSGEDLQIGNIGGLIKWEVNTEPAVADIKEVKSTVLYYDEDMGPPHLSLLLTPTPDWEHRVDYLSDESEEIHVPDSLPPFTAKTVIPIDFYDERYEVLDKYIAAASDKDKYNKHYGSGKEIVGKNNFGEITFPEWSFGEDNKKVKHHLWWRLYALSPDDGIFGFLECFPLTKVTIRMSNNLDDYPRPQNSLNTFFDDE